MKTTAAVLRSAQEPLSLEELDIDELRPVRSWCASSVPVSATPTSG